MLFFCFCHFNHTCSLCHFDQAKCVEKSIKPIKIINHHPIHIRIPLFKAECLIQRVCLRARWVRGDKMAQFATEYPILNLLQVS